MVRDAFVSQRLDGHAERERLGDRLNRERAMAVAGFENASLARHDADAEVFRVRLAELRDVGGDSPVGERVVAVMKALDSDLKFVLFHSRCGGVGRTLS